MAAQWHPLKNKITAANVSLHDHRKYWWVCKEGHEWEISPHNRSCGSGCPYCGGRFAIKGENDLETLCPETAKEWHPIKNRKIKPSDVKPKSSAKVWWFCPVCGYEWRSTVASRTTAGSGCPRCAGKIR